MNADTAHPMLVDAIETLARERRALVDEIRRLRGDADDGSGPPPADDEGDAH